MHYVKEEDQATPRVKKTHFTTVGVAMDGAMVQVALAVYANPYRWASVASSTVNWAERPLALGLGPRPLPLPCSTPPNSPTKYCDLCKVRAYAYRVRIPACRTCCHRSSNAGLPSSSSVVRDTPRSNPGRLPARKSASMSSCSVYAAEDPSAQRTV